MALDAGHFEPYSTNLSLVSMLYLIRLLPIPSLTLQHVAGALYDLSTFLW